MTFKTADRTKETSTTTGTGAKTLLGAAAGFQAFSAKLADGDLCYYMIQGQSTTEWEMGVGLYNSAGPTITSQLVLDSSNAGAATNFSAGTKDVVLTPDAIAFGVSSCEIWGDGSDGALNITSTTVTLARDTCYSSVTISGTGVLNCAGFIPYCNGIVDLSAAGVGAVIGMSGGAGGAGGATGTAGTFGVAVAGSTVGASAGSPGGAGGAGSTAVGGQGNVGQPATSGLGGTSGASGAGGTGGGGAGGANRPAIVPAGQVRTRRFMNPIARGTTMCAGGAGGGGGGAGGGSGTVSGPGGGGGGAGGNVMQLPWRFIKRGGSTAASCIQCTGGAAGAGGTSATSTCGGGGAGGAGAGGAVVLQYQALIGTTATNAIDCGGGAGAVGGAGNGTGTGGNGSAGGDGGWVFKCDLGHPENSGAGVGASGTAGGAGSVPTGGTAGAGGACLVNL